MNLLLESSHHSLLLAVRMGNNMSFPPIIRACNHLAPATKLHISLNNCLLWPISSSSCSLLVRSGLKWKYMLGPSKGIQMSILCEFALELIYWFRISCPEKLLQMFVVSFILLFFLDIYLTYTVLGRKVATHLSLLEAKYLYNQTLADKMKGLWERNG